MVDHPTLFAQMALKFADHPENIAVEALGHILSQSPLARQGLEDVLRSGGSQIGSITRIKTQLSDEDGARPDLAGFDEEQEMRLLIEAKFWAGLTDNQPNGYLAQLPDDGPSALLFVVPEARLEALVGGVRAGVPRIWISSERCIGPTPERFNRRHRVPLGDDQLASFAGPDGSPCRCGRRYSHLR